VPPIHHATFPRVRRFLPLAALVLALLPASPAAAGARDRLWATVNACDSPDSPDTMGIRVNVPGNGTRQRVYVRFLAEWYSRSRGRWLALEGARSPKILAGSARWRYRQEGWSFQFEPPRGGTFLVRGVVRVEWRKRKRKSRRWVVVRRARLTTSKRRPEDADTGEGMAAASCYVR